MGIAFVQYIMRFQIVLSFFLENIALLFSFKRKSSTSQVYLLTDFKRCENMIYT